MQEYKARKDKQKKTPLYNDVLADEKYLSSDHEKESDPIRKILEENDEIYEELNYMEPHHKMVNDPSRK